jgi:hypothetical protein
MEISNLFSRNTLIPYSEISSWSLKTSFWKKIYPKNSKIVMTVFYIIFLYGFETSCLDILIPYSSEIYREIYFSWPFLNFLDNYSYKMIFLNSKKSFQSMGSEYSLKRDWKFPEMSYFIDLRQTRCANNIPIQFWNLISKPKKPGLLWFCKIHCCRFPKPLKEGIFSVSGIFIKDYLRNQMC